MRFTRHAAALIIAAATGLLSGCGGGGGTGSNGGVYPFPGGGTSTITGKVVDMNGNPIPGAPVVADTGQTASSLSQGGFRLDSVPAGTRRIRVSVQQNGETFMGSTQTLGISGTTNSNASIQISRSDQQATVTGTVRDASGRALSGARVYLAVFATSGTGNGDGSLASLVGFADANGLYRIENVPAPVSQYTIAASLQGYQNTRLNVNNLQVGETRQQDFALGNSFGQGGATPTNVQAFAFTQPGEAPRANAQMATGGTSTSGVYAQIRQAMSAAYARRSIGEHIASHTRQTSHVSVFGAYAVEADVFFDNAQPDSVAGFRIYNSQGSSQLAAYDFLQDPLANVYTDLDPYYVPARQYNFAVSAVNTDNQESGLSNTSSFAPLDLLTLAQPQSGQTLSNPATIAWNTIDGASSYAVFVYPQFPSVGVAGQRYDASSGANSLTLPSLASGDYWVVVAGATSDGSAVSISQITRFHVP